MNQTSAATSAPALNISHNLLKVNVAPGVGRFVRITFTNATDLSAIQPARISLGGADQVRIDNGHVWQAGGSAHFSSAPSILNVNAASLILPLRTTTLTLNVEIKSASDAPIVRERWVLTLT